MAYITVSDADAINTESAWTSLSVDEKEYALEMGALFINNEYACPNIIPAEPNLQRANALLGEKYALSELFNQRGGSVIETTVKAGSVMVSEVYEDSEQSEDSFSEIILLMSGTSCVISQSVEFKRV
jgi:hypothetical protein